MRGRGIDFEHRFNTSRWAESLLLHSICEEPGLLAVRFGLSEVRTTGDLKYDKTAWKEPDLLVYRISDLDAAERKFLRSRDLSAADRSMYCSPSDLAKIIKKAVAAIEVEFSPYKANEMKGRKWVPKTPDAWERRPLKNANPPTAPNIWVKEEDLERLNSWSAEFGVPIIVAHMFDQEAFAIPLAAVNLFNKRFTRNPAAQVRLQMTTGIFKKLQSYNRVDAEGAGEKKWVFVVTPGVALSIGAVEGVKVEAQLGLSSSKKYVTHCLFSGGHLTLSKDFILFLKTDKKDHSSKSDFILRGIGRIRENSDDLLLWPEPDTSSE